MCQEQKQRREYTRMGTDIKQIEHRRRHQKTIEDEGHVATTSNIFRMSHKNNDVFFVSTFFSDLRKN